MRRNGFESRNLGTDFIFITNPHKSSYVYFSSLSDVYLLLRGKNLVTNLNTRDKLLYLDIGVVSVGHKECF
jgi:hypothetical protein